MTQKPRIAATIEARMTSSRLPGKVLMPCLGKPMLDHMVERVRRAAVLDDIIIATTVNDTDEPICAAARRLQVKYYRGSEDNVMSRVLEAAQHHDVDIIVELTGDCPLLDPALIDLAVSEYLSSGVDYLCNLKDEDYAAGQSHPLGFAVQVFSTDVLADAYARTDDPLDYEHVSRPLYRNPDRYSVKYLPTPETQRGPNMSVTLDTSQDYQVICAVMAALSPEKPDFSIEDVVAYLKGHPEICRINQDIGRVKV
ncbi:MAG: NTP transferase domain-containing protein [Alphaproteobacteria bacterium]|nr:NTP transferase domain-containing protein [Alphaproteobacteria bacterium]